MKKSINTMLAALMFALIAAASTMASAGETQTQAVNINTATVAELAYLPGIGPSKAEAIVKYRKVRPFKKIEHIMRVKGIGRKSFRKMRPFICIEGATTAKKAIKIAK